MSKDNLNIKPKQALGRIQDGVMGVGIQEDLVEKSPKEKPVKKKQVAIYSTKNLYWEKVGRLSKGYNLVTEENAEQWLTLGHTRIATPEEVAGAYDKPWKF